jgi:hypothetical protein
MDGDAIGLSNSGQISTFAIAFHVGGRLSKEPALIRWLPSNCSEERRHLVFERLPSHPVTPTPYTRTARARARALWRWLAWQMAMASASASSALSKVALGSRKPTMA